MKVSMAVVATITWAAGRRFLEGGTVVGFDDMSRSAVCDYIIKHAERKGWPGWVFRAKRLAARFVVDTTEFLLATLARTHLPKPVKAVYPRRMAVGEQDLHGIIPHRVSTFRRYLGFKHGKRIRLARARAAARPTAGATASREAFRLFALIVAHRARAVLAQIGEVVMRRVPVGPSNVHTCPRSDVNFHFNWLFS